MQSFPLPLPCVVQRNCNKVSDLIAVGGRESLVSEGRELLTEGGHVAIKILLLVVQGFQGSSVLRVQTEASLAHVVGLSLSRVSICGDRLHYLSQISQSLAHLQDLSLHIHWSRSFGRSSFLSSPRRIDELLEV